MPNAAGVLYAMLLLHVADTERGAAADGERPIVLQYVKRWPQRTSRRKSFFRVPFRGESGRCGVFGRNIFFASIGRTG
jgi:hypothetical protein